jgi:hypothetical protein
VSQRVGRREPILLVLMVIPVVALTIDRTLFLLQKSLFPYQYTSRGVLHHVWRGLMNVLEGFKFLFVSARPLDPAQQAALAAAKKPGTR